jgi:hypothetical protein
VPLSHLFCVVSDTSGYFDASPTVTISEVKASPTVFTVTGTEAVSVIRSLSPNYGYHIFVKVIGRTRLCMEELCHIFF